MEEGAALKRRQAAVVRSTSKCVRSALKVASFQWSEGQVGRGYQASGKDADTEEDTDV